MNSGWICNVYPLIKRSASGECALKLADRESEIFFDIFPRYTHGISPVFCVKKEGPALDQIKGRS
jgi:hypothetical protein